MMEEIPVQLSLERFMLNAPVYTIGYGGRSIESFLELLNKYKIEFLIDIRSKPYSKVNQQFSRDNLESLIRQHHMRYVFMGDTLGGRPGDITCYVDGNVDYSKVRERDFYKKGISRIHTAWEKHIHVALMCAELKPQDCHRSKLIGNTLHSQHIEVAHIDETGNLKTQMEVNQLLLGDQLSLFDFEQSSIMANDKINFSRKKYSPLDARKI